MKKLLRISAAVTAVVIMLASCGKTEEDNSSSEIDITSEIFASQAETTTTTTAVESEPESVETTEESSEEEPEESSEEESEEEIEEEESIEEPEESEEEVDTEPEKTPHSGNVTIFKGLGYSFETDDAVWANEQERIAQMQADAAKQAKEMGLDAEMTDGSGNSPFDAIYSYVPDAMESYVSNFNITLSYIGMDDPDLSEIKSELDRYYKSMPDFNLESSEISKFSGRKCIKFVLTTMDLKMVSYTFVYDESMYSVTLSSTADRFDKVSADFDDVIDTFKFE